MSQSVRKLRGQPGAALAGRSGHPLQPAARRDISDHAEGGATPLPTSRSPRIEAINEHGRTALAEAAMAGPFHEKTVEALLDTGADPNSRDLYGRTPIHHASRVGAFLSLRLLLAHGADINMVDCNGRSPLHDAVEAYSLETVAVLLTHKARLHTEDSEHHTPLTLAMKLKWEEGTGLLLRTGACIEQHSASAVQHGLVALVEHPVLAPMLLKFQSNMVQLRADHGRTVMHLAALADNVVLLECVHKAGGSLEVRDGAGMTPLHLASQLGQSSAIQYLLEQAANIDAVDDMGVSSLHMAVAASGLEGTAALELLIAHGADITLPGLQGLSPLAAAAAMGLIPAVRVLLDAHADPNQLDSQLLTPLHHAASTPGAHEVCTLLLEHGSLAGVRDQTGRSPIYMAAAIGQIDSVHAILQHAEAPDGLELHAAVHSGRLDIVDQLLKYGAHPNVANEDGLQPLHLAAALGRKDMADILLQSGAMVEQNLEPAVRQPLHLAAGNGHILMCERLVTMKADVNASWGKQAWTPLDCALAGRHETCANTLCNLQGRSSGSFVVDDPVQVAALTAALFLHEVKEAGATKPPSFPKLAPVDSGPLSFDDFRSVKPANPVPRPLGHMALTTARVAPDTGTVAKLWQQLEKKDRQIVQLKSERQQLESIVSRQNKLLHKKYCVPDAALRSSRTLEGHRDQRQLAQVLKLTKRFTQLRVALPDSLQSDTFLEQSLLVRLEETLDEVRALRSQTHTLFA